MGKNRGKTALLSVFDKKDIGYFGKLLKEAGYTLISTPGTGRRLAKYKIPYIPADIITRNPGGLTDCIQTISFAIQAGILFDRANPTHLKNIQANKLVPIDLVVCNFPPLRKVVKNFNLDFNIRNVDVGGPLMVRAAATNYRHVIIVTDPRDYARIGRAINEDKLTENLRLSLATKAFKCTNRYDQDIVKYLQAQRKLRRTANL